MEEIHTPHLISKDERGDAMGAYLMMFFTLVVGLPFPFLNVLASIFYLLIMRKKSKFVHFHSLQSFLSQLPISIGNSLFVVWIIYKIIMYFTGSNPGDTMLPPNSLQDLFQGSTSETNDAAFFNKNFISIALLLGVLNICYLIGSVLAMIKAHVGKLYFFWGIGQLSYSIVYKNHQKNSLNNTQE